MSSSWIVVGALRDELLGREVTDIDIAVESDPQQAARELAAELRGPVFQLSEAFGAWRVVDRRSGRVYDFAPLQGDTIEEDLAQRDFSVNAMARPLPAQAAGVARGAAMPSGELIDPLGGRADIEARTLRVLGPAAYENDPLRPLRLARFVAELGFTPDAETERLTAEAAPRVAEASGERVFAELRRPQSAGACASCGSYDACQGGCMAAKFFTGLPLDGPDPECVLGHGEAALARVAPGAAPSPGPGHSRRASAPGGVRPPDPARLLPVLQGPPLRSG